MNRTKKTRFFVTAGVISLAMLAIFSMRAAFGADLDEIRERGELRHLGVPYANFVTGSGDGMDVELVEISENLFQLFIMFSCTPHREIVNSINIFLVIGTTGF